MRPMHDTNMTTPSKGLLLEVSPPSRLSRYSALVAEDERVSQAEHVCHTLIDVQGTEGPHSHLASLSSLPWWWVWYNDPPEPWDYSSYAQPQVSRYYVVCSNERTKSLLRGRF